MTAVVENVHANPGVAPVIAITEVGNLKPSNLLNCGLAFEDTARRPILKIFNEKGDTVEEEDTSRKESGKRYLILRNKETNKVSIFGAKMTYFKKPDYYKVKTYEANPSMIANEEFNSVFGTKKSLRASKSRTSNAVDVSTDVFDNISTSATMQLSFSQSSEFLVYLPQGCNRFSDKIETIYPVSSLLHENEIDLMTDYAKEVLSMLPIPADNEDLSKFFITSINRLCHRTIHNICLLTLADGLVELLKQKTGTLNYRSDTVYPNSEVINDKLMDNFVEYSVTGRDLTSKMKDKAVCHIIIIMIIINMNVFDLSWVSSFLPPSSQKRLVLLMKVVGATPTKEDKTKYTLKLPLASLPSFKKESKRSR